MHRQASATAIVPQESDVDDFKRAINSLLQMLVELGNLILAGLVAFERWVRAQLETFGLTPEIQTVIMLALAVLLILGSLRLFGGLIRIVMLLVLVLVAIHIVLPVLPH
jgi:hypothetical protein